MRLAVSLLSALVVAVAGCGSEESASKPQACAPGASVSCTGPGSCSGFQICKPDGSGYTPCDCSGSGGAGGSSGSAGSGGASTVCPSGLKGPALVELKSPAGVHYCMDATEVTFAQYGEFLATKPDGAKVEGSCQYVIFDYDDPVHPNCIQGLDKVADAPARCVSWCAAREYCKWAGKRLCGRIGGGPISTKAGEDDDANLSQWYNACSAGGLRDFPYGASYVGGACNGADFGKGAPLSAGSATACEGGYPSLRDMSGNVWEWEDSCSAATGASDLCRIRGGSFSQSGPTLGCSADSSLARGDSGKSVGFRCCE